MPNARAVRFMRRAKAASDPADRFADGGCGIVGRPDGSGAEQIPEADCRSGTKAQFRRRFSRGIRRDRHFGIQPDLAKAYGFERDVEGHHFGQGGGMQAGVGISRMRTSPLRASMTIAA